MLGLLLSAVLLAQGPASAGLDIDSPLRLSEHYDRIIGGTTLATNLGVIYQKPRTSQRDGGFNLDMHLLSLYLGEGRSKPLGEPRIKFVCQSREGWQFLRSPSLVLLLDDSDRVYINDLKRTSEVGKGYTLEQLDAKIPADAMRKLAAAKSVEGNIGGVEFSLTVAQMKALGEFARIAADPSLKIPPPVPVGPTPEQQARERANAEQAEKRLAAEKQLADDRAAAVRLESKLKSAASLEKISKSGAIRVYRDIQKDYPGTPASEKAADRIRELEAAQP